jgi:hypothetical protein
LIKELTAAIHHHTFLIHHHRQRERLGHWNATIFNDYFSSSGKLINPANVVSVYFLDQNSYFANFPILVLPGETIPLANKFSSDRFKLIRVQAKVLPWTFDPASSWPVKPTGGEATLGAVATGTPYNRTTSDSNSPARSGSVRWGRRTFAQTTGFNLRVILTSHHDDRLMAHHSLESQVPLVTATASCPALVSLRRTSSTKSVSSSTISTRPIEQSPDIIRPLNVTSENVSAMNVNSTAP